MSTFPLGCDDDDPAETPAAPGSRSASPSDEDDGAPEAPAAADLGPVIPRFDLVAHVARADVHDRTTLVMDFGEPSGAKYTLGGWRTRVGDDHDFEGTRAMVVPGVTGKVMVPGGLPGATPIRFHARSLSDRRVTLYINDETIGHGRLDRDTFTTVSVTADEGKLAEESFLGFRVPSTGSRGGARGGLAIDWIRVGPDEGGAPPRFAQNGKLVIPNAWSLSYPFVVMEGARLRGVVTEGALVLTALQDGAAPIELGRHEGPVDVDLSAHAGKLIQLSLRAEGALEFVAPQIVTPRPREVATLATRPKNVLVYLVDTVRADKLSPWNPDTRVETPGLTRWVRNASVFERGHTQENWTKPSVATLLSGLLPWQHTATDGEAVLPRSVSMISEVLKDEGFHTGSFICNGYVSDKFGFRQGWSTYRNYIREGRRTQARFVAGDVLEWLDARPEDKPFMLYVHTIDPHVPYIPPDDLLQRYDPDPYDGPVDFRRDRELLEKIKSGALRTNARDRRRLEALYDGEISYHDVHFASIVDGLESRGILDETMIVFTADHGEEFFDHESVGHGHSLYEELLHVPLIMQIPGVSPRRVDAPTGLVDVMPTVLDVLGVDAPERQSGRSVLPLLLGAETDAPRVTVSGFMRGWRAVEVDGLKLIQRTENRAMLFALERDPDEETNLAQTHPIALRYTRAMLGLALRGATSARHQAVSTEIDPETDAQLRALGYVGTQRPGASQ